MANRRDLKKDINLIINEFAEQILSFMDFADTANYQKADDLLTKTADLLDELMFDINHHSELNGKEVKVHFTKVERKLEENIDKLEKEFDTLTGNTN